MSTPRRTAPHSERWTVEVGGSLAELVAQSLAGASKKRVTQLIKHGAVSINDQVIRRADHVVEAGARLTIVFGLEGGDPHTLPSNLRIVYQDEHLIVVDKPAGLLSIGTDSERAQTAHALLCRYVAEQARDPRERVFVVHRLDQGTSGLLVFARTEEAKHALQQSWSSACKIYLAVVEGVPTESQGTLRSYLRENRAMRVHSSTEDDGKLAVTHYRLLASTRGRSLLEVRLETGRKHQIRVHLSDLGHPVLGDRLYGSVVSLPGRLALHAHRLELLHPVTSQLITHTSPLPDALQALLPRLNEGPRRRGTSSAKG